MPRTEAGKRLLEQSLYGRAPGEEDYYYTVDIEPAIEAIEAEAVAAERARTRAAVEGLPQTHGYGEVRRWVDVAAVLAILDDHA